MAKHIPVSGCWREKRSASQIEWDKMDGIVREYHKVDTGDYCTYYLDGTGLACWEVKSSKEDLHRTVTRDWDNFQKQGERMATGFDYCFILIRPTREELWKKSRYARGYSAKLIFKRLAEWCQEYGIVPIFGFTDKDIEFLVRIFGEAQ